MRRLSITINDGVSRWASGVAREHGLEHAPLVWRVTRYERKVKGSPRNGCPPATASAILGLWADVLGLVHRQPTCYRDVGKVIYAGRVDNHPVEIVAMVDRAANRRARLAHRAGRGALRSTVVEGTWSGPSLYLLSPATGRAGADAEVLDEPRSGRLATVPAQVSRVRLGDGGLHVPKV
ncbi:hypothetical protein AB0I60_05800 [Actinosynnema sp. NPDC050436]|uniref:hypothetical protein n=1 Tax=Actinosynnema sp. NPDC050436 TaxID=3155659 RepID=UPI0033F4843B